LHFKCIIASTSPPYIQRSIEAVLVKAVQQFPAVVLTGPRQAGKTTILKHLFSKSHRYISLEPPDVRSAAAADPRGFIELYKPPVIFDEIQYAPDLLFYIKEKIDQHRSSFGQYILTGSQNTLLMQQATETLAGRTALLQKSERMQDFKNLPPSTPREERKLRVSRLGDLGVLGG
jgi:hypothetical protein